MNFFLILPDNRKKSRILVLEVQKNNCSEMRNNDQVKHKSCTTNYNDTGMILYAMKFFSLCRLFFNVCFNGMLFLIL